MHTGEEPHFGYSPPWRVSREDGTAVLRGFNQGWGLHSIGGFTQYGRRAEARPYTALQVGQLWKAVDKLREGFLFSWSRPEVHR